MSGEFMVSTSATAIIEGVEDPSFVRDDSSTLGDDGSKVITFPDVHDLDELIEGPAARSCFRCHGPLELGFIADFQHGTRVMKPSECVALITPYQLGSCTTVVR